MTREEVVARQDELLAQKVALPPLHAQVKRINAELHHLAATLREIGSVESTSEPTAPPDVKASRPSQEAALPPA